MISRFFLHARILIWTPLLLKFGRLPPPPPPTSTHTQTLCCLFKLKPVLQTTRALAFICTSPIFYTLDNPIFKKKLVNFSYPLIKNDPYAYPLLLRHPPFYLKLDGVPVLERIKTATCQMIISNFR